MNKIKDLRSTERGRAIFKLSLYGLFFFIILILCIVGGNIESPQKTKKESTSEESREVEKNDLTYFEKQELLLSEPYAFEYTIKRGDETITYVGDHRPDSVEGYRETKDELIHYKIENGEAYRISLNESTLITDLYLDLDKSIFDLKNVFATLNGISAQIEKDASNKIYNYRYDGKTYKVVVGRDNIKKLDVEDEIAHYVLEFYK